ncbi:MAG: LysR family transcriptional regulator [Paracoccus sp. (in: a-proteobacteria)]|nr:LysR family transcriptional regulator [Paracoccus sp. (in: a-proteobacteria)]
MKPSKALPVPNIQDIDLKLLRAFVSVAANGSFAVAQTELNIGASTISGYISTLEARLGVSLCKRGRSGFRLTEAGIRIHEAATLLFHDLEQFRARVGEAREELTGRFILGMVDAVANLADNIVPECLREFVPKAPSLHLELRLGTPASLVSDLIEKQIDAAIIPVFREPAGTELVALDPADTQALYCGVGHPFFFRADTDIPIDEIRAAPFVNRAHMEGWGRYSANRFNAMASTVDMECQLILILTGKYIGHLPERYVTEYVQRGLLREVRSPSLRYGSNICLAVRADDDRPAVQTLVSVAKSLAAARGFRPR